MANKKSIIVPQGEDKNFYLVGRAGGPYQWYIGDPFIDKDAKKVKLEDYLLNLTDKHGFTVTDPLAMKGRVCVLERSTPFDISLPNKVRTGQIDLHFVDEQGNCVDILEVTNHDSEYPFNGVVFKSDGSVLSTRCYSGSGICSDKNPEHNILALSGTLKDAMAFCVEEPEEDETVADNNDEDFE